MPYTEEELRRMKEYAATLESEKTQKDDKKKDKEKDKENKKYNGLDALMANQKSPFQKVYSPQSILTSILSGSMMGGFLLNVLYNQNQCNSFKIKLKKYHKKPAASA